MRKTKQVNIRLTEKEIKILQIICERYNFKSISDYVRHASLNHDKFSINLKNEILDN